MEIPENITPRNTSCDGNGTNDNYIADLNSVYDKHLSAFISSSKYICIVMYILGYPGNILAFLVWIRKPMLQCSGVYLTSLAMSNLLYISLDFLVMINIYWSISVSAPVICEGFVIVIMAAQYMSPLLTLAFTTERYIAIKLPLRRRLYCTVRRAVCTSVCIAITSLGLCGIQGYFYSYDNTSDSCVKANTTDELWEKWTWGTEIIMFLCVPFLILLINILVICEIQKARKRALTLHRILFKTHATTTMLLAVSFFLILTTLPVSIVYSLYSFFPPGNLTNLTELETDNNWQVHFQYIRAKTVLYNIGKTHYFMNFFTYILTGERFRKEVLNVLQCKTSRSPINKYRSTTTNMESSYSSHAV